LKIIYNGISSFSELFVVRKSDQKEPCAIRFTIRQTSEFSGTSFAPKNFTQFFSLNFVRCIREKNQKRMPTGRLSGREDSLEKDIE